MPTQKKYKKETITIAYFSYGLSLIWCFTSIEKPMVQMPLNNTNSATNVIYIAPLAVKV